MLNKTNLLEIYRKYDIAVKKYLKYNKIVSRLIQIILKPYTYGGKMTFCRESRYITARI